MTRRLIPLLLLTAAGCATTSAEPQPPAAPATAPASAPDGYDMAAQRARFADVRMTPDVSFLNAEERQVVNLLIQAADLMSAAYLRQVNARNPEIRQAIAAGTGPDRDALLDMFYLHFGPWDTLAEYHPFYGDRPAPAGAGFYPEDLTREAFEAYLTAHPDQREALTSG